MAATASGPGAEEPCDPRDLDCNAAIRGRGAFQNPPEMWVGTLSRLDFAVGGTDQALRRELGGESPPPEALDVFIGRCMRVTLETPPSLEIRGANGVTTRLARDMDRASWSWSVMPLEPGAVTVRAKVEVLRQEGGRCTEEAFDQYTERARIAVRIGRWKGFLRAVGEAKSVGDLFAALFASWERVFVALAALLTAVGGAYAAFKALGRRKRKGRVKRAK